MGGKSIPCLEGSLTDDAEVGHVQVDLCVSFSGLFSHKGLVAAEAEESSIMSSRYHLIHMRIQVRFVSISATSTSSLQVLAALLHLVLHW